MARLLFKMDLSPASQSTLIEGTLHVMEGSTSIKSFKATSGGPPYQHRRAQHLRGKGPIPACRKVGISNYSAPTTPYQISAPGAAGNFYHITPDVIVEGVFRSQFGFHRDANRPRYPGSAGCIVFIDPHWTNFQNFMREYKNRGFSQISLIVEYNTPAITPSVTPAGQEFFKVNQPTSGQNISVNQAITFSGTAKPEVSTIIALVGPGGPFKIADLKNVDSTWSFTQTFITRGVNRPFRFRAFDSSGDHLQDISFNLTVQ